LFNKYCKAGVTTTELPAQKEIDVANQHFRRVGIKKIAGVAWTKKIAAGVRFCSSFRTFQIARRSNARQRKMECLQGTN
jgi:hypothetical protein